MTQPVMPAAQAEALRRQLGELAKVMTLLQAVLGKTVQILEQAGAQKEGPQA